MSEISEPQPTQTSGTSEQPRPTGSTLPEALEQIEEIDAESPLVGIIMGSKNDMEKMQPAEKALEDAGIRCEVRVMSAHRDPEMVTRVLHQREDAGAEGDHRRRRDVGGAARASPPPTPSCR